MHTKVVKIAVFNGSKLLFGMRNDDHKYTFPGGHLKPNELPEVGAIRELFEETGLHAHNLDYLGSKTLDRPDKQLTIYAYRCDGVGDTHTSNDPDNEVCEWVYVDVANGVPHDILDKLHSPKDVALDLLGLQDMYAPGEEPSPHQDTIPLTDQDIWEDAYRGREGNTNE